MIVDFSVQNFRSIKDLQTISFVATGLKSPEDCIYVDSNNVETECSTRLLKTVGIYGANGSGKSNVVRALEYFIQAIRMEPSPNSNLSFLCDPFLYQDNPDDEPSYFQITLIIKEKKYRYGFTIKRNKNYNGEEAASKELIESEWLFGQKEVNMVKLFTRKDMQLTDDTRVEQDKVPPIPYAHSLYLIHEAAFVSDGASVIVRSYFKNWTLSNLRDSYDTFRWNTVHFLEKENGTLRALKLLEAFNLKYDDIIIERDGKESSRMVTHDKIFLKKNYLTSDNELRSIMLNLAKNESAGTQKLFDLVGVLLRGLKFNMGAFIVLDEVDSNFHPALLVKIISLFNNPEMNNSHMQLLFTSHDTNLMSPAIMRRDQFYFTEKRDDSSTRLYSLADLKGIRNDADFARQYLSGYYGALPVFEEYLDTTQTEVPDGSMGA